MTQDIIFAPTTQNWAPMALNEESISNDEPQLPTSNPLSSQVFGSGPRGKTFPLIKLPLELRYMVYLEVLRPTNCHHLFESETDSMGIKHSVHSEEEQQIRMRDSQHRANFLATSRQVNAEASDIWYATRYFKATVCPWLTFEGGLTGICRIQPTPRYLPKLRNLEIHITPHKFSDSDFKSIFYGSAMSNSLEILCQELITNCPKLTDLSLVVPCVCHENEYDICLVGVLEWYHFNKHRAINCLTSEEFEQMTRPLRRLGVSRSIQLRSLCKKRALHYHCL